MKLPFKYFFGLTPLKKQDTILNCLWCLVCGLCQRHIRKLETRRNVSFVNSYENLSSIQPTQPLSVCEYRTNPWLRLRVSLISSKYSPTKLAQIGRQVCPGSSIIVPVGRAERRVVVESTEVVKLERV